MTQPVIGTAVLEADVGIGSSGDPIDITGVVIGGVDRYLAVVIEFNNNDFQVVDSVQIDPGGGDETDLSELAGTLGIIEDDGYSVIWGVVNPPVGTFTVRVILSSDTASDELAAAVAYPMTGVLQSDPVGDTGSFSGVSGSPSVSLTSSPNEQVLGGAFVEEVTGVSLDSPGVQDFEPSPQADTAGFGHQDGAASFTMAWTLGSSDKTVASAAAFAGLPEVSIPVFMHEYRQRHQSVF